MTRVTLLLYAFGIGLASVLLTRLGFTLALGRPFRLSPALDGTQLMLVTMPFVLLAIANIRDRAAWATGLTLTALLWGYALFDGIRAQVSDNGNPNMTLGVLLLASPLIIALACLGAYMLGRRKPRA